MIPIKRFKGTNPAIGYTDFTSVFLSDVLYGQQYETVLKHECAHIWLQHGPRGRRQRADERAAFNARLWNVAADMEIAKHIYDAVDDAAITMPRSWLATGIRKIHADKYPDCAYAEEFYAALLECQKDIPESHDGEANDESLGEDEGEEQDALAPADLVVSAKEKIESALQEHRIAQNQKNAQDAIKDYRPPSTLASVLDHWLSNPAMAREESHRRPPRRQTTNIIKKGVITTPKQPRIIVYVDRSGSFDETKTRAATAVLNRVLRKYRASIKTDTLYFNDYVFSTDPKFGYGGTNYGAVVQSINENCPELVVIITDDDQCQPGLKVNGKTGAVIIPVGTTATHIARVLGCKEVNL